MNISRFAALEPGANRWAESSLAALLDSAAESVYERFGGSAYLAVRAAAASAQAAYLGSLAPTGGSAQLRACFETRAAALKDFRERLIAEVRPV